MRVLICFDVDGTLESSNGPVTVAKMRRLQELGATVVSVSPSGASPNRTMGTDFPEHVNGAARSLNLLAAASEFPSDLLLYVSDNGDMTEAEAAGFTYVDRFQFR